MIKVVTIVLFLLLGASLLFGILGKPIGTVNYTAHGGFLPHGWIGVGLGVAMTIFSYLGLEVVAITSGEAEHPEIAVPRAMRQTLLRLAIFYIGGMTILVGVLPWTLVGLTESPFVTVFRTVGIPAAAGVMNFVVLTAALSSVNCNLYITSRMIFSLARGGYAPASLGKLSQRGTPVRALLVSSGGMLVAAVLVYLFHERAYVYMLGPALFGGLYAWIMIFVTYLFFRRRSANNPRILRFAPPGPWSSLFGLAALLAVLISTQWIPDFRITLRGGLPWLGFITLCYFVWAKSWKGRPAATEK
jgi:AAT family amino acid transporter